MRRIHPAGIHTTSSMRSGSSSWPGVVGSVSVLTFALGFSYMVGVCGVVVRVFGVPSRSLLGRSVLGARLIWAVVAPRCAGAAAAAAPVAMLATGVAVPAEAELPAGAAMGLGSHGERTVGSPSSASAFFFDVFALQLYWAFALVFPVRSRSLVAPTGCSSPVSRSSLSLSVSL